MGVNSVEEAIVKLSKNAAEPRRMFILHELLEGEAPTSTCHVHGTQSDCAVGTALIIKTAVDEWGPSFLMKVLEVLQQLPLGDSREEKQGRQKH
jgi:hypothetical protein